MLWIHVPPCLSFLKFLKVCLESGVHTRKKQGAWRWHVYWIFITIIIIIINPLTARVAGAPQMILQPVFSIFPCSPLPSRTCRTPGLSIPWCSLPISSFVCLVFFPLSLCLARWFWPDLKLRGSETNLSHLFVSFYDIALTPLMGKKIWNRVDCQRSEKKSKKIHKRLNSQHYLIRQNKMHVLSCFKWAFVLLCLIEKHSVSPFVCFWSPFP